MLVCILLGDFVGFAGSFLSFSFSILGSFMISWNLHMGHVCAKGTCVKR